MSLCVVVKLDVRSALRRGFPINVDAQGRVRVEIPDPERLPADHRALLADHLEIDGNQWTVNVGGSGYPTVPEPTVNGILEVLTADVARLVEAINTRDEKVIKGEEWIDGLRCSWPVRVPRLRISHIVNRLPAEARAAYKQWRADMEAANEAAKADAITAARQMIVEDMAVKVRFDSERKAWIELHGSPRLRRLIKEHIEHTAVYRDERLKLERPGWRWRRPDEECGEPRNPPEEAFILLDEARKTVPDAKLVFVKGSCRPTPGDEIEARFYAAQASFLDRKILWDESEG